MSDSLSYEVVPKVAVPQAAADTPPYWQTVFRRLRNDWLTLAVGAILVGIVSAAIFAPVLAPYSPYSGSILHRLAPIGTPGHWLGTDETGRDIWTRLLYGGRLSLLAGISPVIIALAIGGSLGVIAGYSGGLANSVIMRATDTLYAFPSVLLAVAICGILGNGLLNSILALAAIFVPPMVRISESVTSQVRVLPFMEAAKASGASDLQIIRHHVISNIVGTILVYATSLFSLSIILASGLSFLGLGVNPPDAEWGLMLNSLRQAIYVQPLVAALPGLLIFITSMCFNLMSDGLRSAMDTRLSE